MFDRKKVTDDNVKAIANAVLRDPLLVKALALYKDPGEDPRLTEYRIKNCYRIVYFFISIVEYLDRTGRLSFASFSEYAMNVHNEMFEGDFTSHTNRCRKVKTGVNDFILKAAASHEQTMSDVFYINLVLAHFKENEYSTLLECCKTVLSTKDNRNIFFTLFKNITK